MLKPIAALVVALLLAMPGAAWAQQTPTFQGGAVHPGDIPKYQSNGQITGGGDILGDANGNGVNPFSILDKSDQGLCFRTDNSSQPHVALCIGHDADGNGLITLDSLGGATAKALKCRINGTLNDCFSTSSGGGGGGGGGNPPPPGNAVALNAGGCILLNSGGCLAKNP